GQPNASYVYSLDSRPKKSGLTPTSLGAKLALSLYKRKSTCPPSRSELEDAIPSPMANHGHKKHPMIIYSSQKKRGC
ncbi:MAG: hypothetical protein KC643_21165, partial [Nitrospira sp.]|nr:hypothetical protein [Nitrospira sp.]